MKRLAVALLLIPSVSAFSQSRKDVETLIQRYMEAAGVPGMSYAIARHGKVIMKGAIGLAEVENEAKLRPDSIFEIGSVTKQFTATLIMQLVKEGRIELDAAVSTYLPDLPQAWQPVTITQLLNHTSGLPEYLSPVYGFNIRKDYRDGEIVKMMEKFPLDYQPGESWMYSNLGYFLLGVLIEKITGREYEQELQDRLFAPLGMQSTSYFIPYKVYKHRAFGYMPSTKEVRVPETLRPSGAFSAGAVVSTAPDMALFASKLLAGEVLATNLLEKIWTPASLRGGRSYPYGFGWFLDEHKGVRIVHHGGNTFGNSAEVCLFPSENLAIVLLGNLYGGNYNGLARQIAGLYVADLKKTKKLKTNVDPNRDVTLKLFRTMQTLLNSQKNAELMDSELLGVLSSSRGSAGVAGLRAALGQIKSLRYRDHESLGTDTVYVYEIIFEKATVPMKLTVTKEAKLARFDVLR